jgi:hypothetical protein
MKEFLMRKGIFYLREFGAVRAEYYVQKGFKKEVIIMSIP